MKEYLIKRWEDTRLVRDKKIIEAFKKIPREEFMVDEYRDHAYVDTAYPIIEGQTISQPSTIMIMTQALEPKLEDKVLEIGAGSGYQAALLSKLCKKVYTVERIPGVFGRSAVVADKRHCDVAFLESVTVADFLTRIVDPYRADIVFSEKRYGLQKPFFTVLHRMVVGQRNHIEPCILQSTDRGPAHLHLHSL